MTMKYIILYFLTFLFVQNLSANSSGEISGKVVDKFTQQPVADVLVEIPVLNLKTGSNENGSFKFSDVPTGTYFIKFYSVGYRPFSLSDVVVATGEPVVLYIELDIVQTDEIVVQSEIFSKPSDISTSFKSLNYEEIRRSPGGFEDIGRVIQTLPGVAFVNDGRNDLIVRGGAPTENLFLVDNAPVPNINHFGSQGATGGPVSIIDLTFIREANFITGGFSAKYGDKLSSVLDIKLREGNRQKFMADIDLSATGFGTVLEGPIGSKEKGSWLFSAKRSYLDFVFSAVGFGFIPEYTSFQFKGVYDISKNVSLIVNAIGNIDKVRFNNDKLDNKQKNENILTDDQWGYVNSFEVKVLTSRSSYALFSLSRNYTNFSYSGRNANFEETFKNNSVEGETQVASEYYWMPMKSTQFSFGAGAKLINFVNEIKSQADTLYYTNPGQVIIPGVDINADNNSIKAYSYAQITQKVFDRLKINLGLRYDYFGYIEKKNYVSPRVSATYNITSRLNLNLSYGIFYQSPSYIWLITNPSNRNLEDIRANHYVAGIEYMFTDDLKATVEVYQKDYSKDPVSTLRPYYILANNGGDYPKPENFSLEPLISAGVGYARGIEFYLQKALTDKLFGTVNLSLFEAKYTSLDGIERASDYDNKFIFIINGGYLFGKGWQASSKFRFVGGRPYTPINPNNGIQEISLYNNARYPDYYSLDVRVDKRWDFSKWSLVTYVDIQNITGRKNITNYQWDKYNNNIRVSESIGVFPTIGVNAMF